MISLHLPTETTPCSIDQNKYTWYSSSKSRAHWPITELDVATLPRKPRTPHMIGHYSLPIRSENNYNILGILLHIKRPIDQIFVASRLVNESTHNVSSPFSHERAMLSSSRHILVIQRAVFSSSRHILVMKEQC